MTLEKNDYPKASNFLVYGGLMTYIAGLFLLIAFASPYWVQSFEETFSNFKNMGLWEYCFFQFHFPNNPYYHLFNGCHYIFSHEYYIISEWLLPGWLMAVQTFVTLAFILSFMSQIIMAMQLCRWPLEFVLQYEWILSGINFVSTATASVFLFFAATIFGGSHIRRDWLMYPNYNYLSWSYGFACLSFFFHAFAALFLYKETRQSYELRPRKRESRWEDYRLSQLRDSVSTAPVET